MQTVIFLIGIAATQRHHSQVRKCPRATFFNGVSHHQSAIGRDPPASTIPQPVSTAHRRAQPGTVF